MINSDLIEQSVIRIKPHIQNTPLTYDPVENIYYKWENHQVTGSFKVRGAFNKILTLQPNELNRDLVAASAGNHGQGVALAGNLLGSSVTIFCSEKAVPAKVQAMKDLGAQVNFIKGGYAQAEDAGKQFAIDTQSIWISPYNDKLVIAGQATLGVEILEDLPPNTEANWYVPVGGGGLIAGIGTALQTKHIKAKLIGVQSEASPFFHSIFHYDTQDNAIEKSSLADGLTGCVDTQSITIPLVKHFVDDFVLVSESEIRSAIKYAWLQYGEIIEGSAAAPLAAVLSGKMNFRPAVIILTGGNIQPELHADIVGEDTHPEISKDDLSSTN